MTKMHFYSTTLVSKVSNCQIHLFETSVSFTPVVFPFSDLILIWNIPMFDMNESLSNSKEQIYINKAIYSANARLKPPLHNFDFSLCAVKLSDTFFKITF